jgi:hypothetical protein
MLGGHVTGNFWIMAHTLVEKGLLKDLKPLKYQFRGDQKVLGIGREKTGGLRTNFKWHQLSTIRIFLEQSIKLSTKPNLID